MKSTDDGMRFQPSNKSGGEKKSNKNTQSPKNDVVRRQNIIPKTAGGRLAMSTPGDSSEREADRMAEQVMKNHAGEKLENAGGASTTESGRSLNRKEQSFFEKGFRQDLQQVRIHDDENANALAQQLNARAFTYGADIYFAAGEHSSDSQGQKLLAHELGHVVQQQRSGRPLVQRQERPGSSLSLPSPGPLTSPSLAEFIGSSTIDGFAFGRSTLDSTQEGALRDYAITVSRLLREHPGSHIELIGHTDAPGEATDNIALGQARADAVQTFLIAEGLDPARLSTSSAGETRLRIETRGRDRRNRRVEIRFRTALPFGLGLNLPPLSSIPSPDATVPPSEPGPRVPMPWEIPPHLLLPPEPLGPRRPTAPNIFNLPPVTRPPSESFLRELSRWLTRSLGRREIARLAARMAAELGMDEAEVRRELDDALVSAGEAGLKEILERIIHGLAGAPSSRPPDGTGPVPPTGVPGERIFRLPPIPF